MYTPVVKALNVRLLFALSCVSLPGPKVRRGALLCRTFHHRPTDKRTG